MGGLALNGIGIAYLAFAVVTFNFPSVYPVDSSNMNYTSAAVGVSALIAAVTWFTTGKTHYTGPGKGGILEGRRPRDSSPTPERVGVAGGVKRDALD